MLKLLKSNYLKIISITIPFLALGIQWLVWSYISPFVWFLFYPAVFLSARLGGKSGGLISTVLSALIVWYFFLPYQLSWELANYHNAYSIIIFVIMGYFFSDTNERLNKASKKIKQSLEDSIVANKMISELYEKTKELDIQKSHFFANISHELRTPLTLIMGCIKKTISNPLINSEIKNDMETAERNARYLYRHVTDILDISKLESKRMIPVFIETNIVNMLNITCSQFDTLAHSRNITFIVDSPDAIIAQTDIEKFQRILLNLLSNAFKFTQVNGEISVSLTAENNQLILKVKDSGSGIPLELQDLIFERFRQLQENHGGTGLGLSIVKEFCILLGGTVSVSSIPENGSTFIVQLPLQAPEGTQITNSNGFDAGIEKETVDELTTWKSNETANGNSGLNKKHLILLVEDNIDLNRFIAGELGKYYSIEKAYNGKEGLEKALSIEPDLIITDEMMPVMNGEKMVMNLLQDKTWATIPIIMLTAKADDELRMRMLQSGISDFINKPFEIDELLAQVDNQLTKYSKIKSILDDSEKRYRLIAENVGDVMWIFDIETLKFRYVSPSVKQLRGYTEDEALVQNITDVITPESRVYFEQIIPERINEFSNGIRKTYVDEVYQTRRNSSKVCTETTTRFVYNPETSHLDIYGVSRDITERKTYENQLKDSLKEREILLKELFHRTKNNMNVIIGILELKASYSNNPDLSELLKDIENKIRVMSLVHEKLYRSNNLVDIDLKDYIMDITSLILKSGNSFNNINNIIYDLETVYVSIDIAVPVGLILNELISNTSKHAYTQKNKGNVNIILKYHNNALNLIYSDHGKGVSPDFDFKSQPTLGLQTIYMIIKHQLGGIISFKSNSGIECNMSFKNKNYINRGNF